ncbi:MAG: PilC/PilY family type IV pilus protein, partial [Woeseiaceae bacterium]|nr:PilC/PilY family type IV pilus protein [Woeseiaceae bacterium]
MKITAKKFSWMTASCLLAGLLGMPAVADDTELLLVAPDQSSLPFNANILLIIDSSGSMGTLEDTTEPYDSTVTYSGDCDTNLLYWSQVDTVPVCDGDNKQAISKSAYVCKKSERQIAGVGLFSDVMVQYRSDLLGAARWMTLEPGNSSDTVECQEDSGFHGENGSGSLVYAMAGAGLAKFTDNPALEIAWGSYPTSETYTVYDGNYLNWRSSPVSVERSRLDIVKTSTKIALDSINSSNIGIMRFNDNQGGPVILGMTDLDGNRAMIDSVIDGINAGGRTPIAETTYESALYWLGAEAYYGNNVNEHATDPGALASTNPEVYLAPDSPVCTKNYNVLLTDGEPVDDAEAQTLAPTLPNFAAKLGRTACTGTAQGDCLDDITEYLSIPDLDSNQPGEQFVTTHTIGFTIDLPILKQAAEVSGGNYYLADDVESLTLALLEIFDVANKQALAFTAPSVAVNTFNRTQNRNDLYMTVFSAESRAHWPGNLKKYAISGGQIVDSTGANAVDPATGFFADAAKSYWTVGDPDGKIVRAGGAANLLPAPASRKLYTNNGADSDLSGASNAISVANEGAFTLADFGLTGASGEPSKTDLINWARGADVRDEDNDASTTQRFAMGDPLHAQPAAIDYGTTTSDSDIVVYVATNDGYLHAFDGDTGVELWSFIPKELLSRLTKLYFDPSTKYKSYGLDGDVMPVVADKNNNGVIDGDDFVYLLFGMRRGGDTYYALDVTDKNSPKLLWTKTLPEFGQTWAAPIVARVDIDDPSLNADKAVAFVGGGYDPVHDTP